MIRLALFAMMSTAFAGTVNVDVKNSSAWQIHQLFVSPADEAAWGEDQLGDKVIPTGGSFELLGIPCNTYDVKVVDEDADECVVSGVKICEGNETWEITDDSLLACQVATE